MSEKKVKCSNCGQPMVLGKIKAVSDFPVALYWKDDKDKGRWSSGERLESFWKSKGLKAYRCKECGIIVAYEQSKEAENE